jgi:hypothetical protein
LGSRSEISSNFLDVVLQKDGENHLDQLCKMKAVLHGVKEERNIIHTIMGRKTNRSDNTLLRNSLLKYII